MNGRTSRRSDQEPALARWFGKYTAPVAGPPPLDLLDDRREPIEEIRREVEPDVRYANIATIEGAGRYGNTAVERS